MTASMTERTAMQSNRRQGKLVPYIRSQHRETTAEITAIDAATAAGAALCEARTACKHGEWLPFLEAAGVPERKAPDDGLDIPVALRRAKEAQA